MESRPDLKFQRILESVQQHFDFLFRRGFCIASVVFVDPNYENWRVTMTTEDYLLRIYGDRGEVNLALNTYELSKDLGLLDLEDLIYLVNGNEIFSNLQEERPLTEPQRLQRLAWLLEKHIDDILAEIEQIFTLPPKNDLSNTPLNKPGRLSLDDRPGFLF
jgi:hypothetical protein